MAKFNMTRRGLIIAGTGLTLAGCDRIVNSPSARPALTFGEHASMGWQRLIGRDALAKEFSRDMISPVFKANGSINPQTPDYLRHASEGFRNWRLVVDGLVNKPVSFSLAELRAMPARNQITRHDCVEGWSAIGEWTGVPLATLLNAAGMQPEARYVIFHCLDNLGGEEGKGGQMTPGQYYESVDLVDAFHPQTIVAYNLNRQPLGIPHGAPARMRIERQLGYKHAKYLARVEVVSSFTGMAGGRGGYWEDRGYEWYAGI